MNHSFGKHALVTAVAIVALLCMTWPAQALKVTTGGMGKHLLFAQWNTMDYRDTYIAIHSPLGVKAHLMDQPMNMVTIMIRDGAMPGLTKAMYGGAEVKQAASLAELRICLTPGDTWTAVLTAGDDDMSTLMVGDAGECDGSVHISAADEPGRGEDPSMAPMTPEMGMEYSIGGQMGFVEAYSSARSYLDEDGNIAYTEDDAFNTEGYGERASDGSEDDMTVSMSITGTAYLVSPMMGFASNYNGVALMCHAVDDGDGSDGIKQCTNGDEINTALTGGVADTSAPGAIARNNNERKVLMGRWVTEPMIGASTDVALTFPGTNKLNYQMKDRGEDAEGSLDDTDVANVDPVTMLVFDEMGNIVAESREVMLGMAVNMCSFSTMMMGMDGDMMDGDMMDGDDHDHDHDMDGDMMTAVMCNGEMVGDPFMATGGTFRIHNTAVVVIATDATGTDAGSRPGDISGNTANAAGMTGAESTSLNLEGLDETEPPDGDFTDEAASPPVAGQLRDDDPGPTYNTLPAIGLVMQTFDTEMYDGKIFDQLAPIWHTGEPVTR